MMTSRKSGPLRVPAALSFALVAGAVHAGSTTCDGSLSGTFGNIVVPAGGGCLLTDSIVNGNIAVQAGAILMIDFTMVNGNISATDPQVVRLQHRVDVHGNVSITGASGFLDIAPVAICGVHIDGNLKIADSAIAILVGGVACGPLDGSNVVSGNVTIEDNDVANAFYVQNNTIGKNMTIDGNTGAATKNVSDNAVTGNLNCSDNDAPLVVSGNTAKKLNGQCKP